MPQFLILFAKEKTGKPALRNTKQDLKDNWGFRKKCCFTCDDGSQPIWALLSERSDVSPWDLETPTFAFKLFQSLWNLTGTFSAALPRCFSELYDHYNIQSRGFTRTCGKTSVRLVNRGPEYIQYPQKYFIPGVAKFVSSFEINLDREYTTHRYGCCFHIGRTSA